MTLKTKLSRAEHEALDESLKTLYVPNGDGFKLDADYEDVEGLKRSKAEILAEKKRIEEEAEELRKFKAEIAAKEAEAETEKLKRGGDFEELEKKLRARIAEVEAERDSKIAEIEKGRDTKIGEIMGNLKNERLKNLLIEKGVLPDRTNYALSEMASKFDLESGEGGFTLKLKDGIGDAKEIDTAIEGLRSKSAFLFADKSASGSGASGSGNNGGAMPKTATKEQVRAMSKDEKKKFYLSDGQVTS
jgi:hypothetical protein